MRTGGCELQCDYWREQGTNFEYNCESPRVEYLLIKDKVQSIRYFPATNALQRGSQLALFALPTYIHHHSDPMPCLSLHLPQLAPINRERGSSIALKNPITIYLPIISAQLTTRSAPSKHHSAATTRSRDFGPLPLPVPFRGVAYVFLRCNHVGLGDAKECWRWRCVLSEVHRSCQERRRAAEVLRPKGDIRPNDEGIFFLS